MDRSSRIIKTSIIGIVVNVLLAAFKGVVGLLAGSIAIIMDALNNISDALSSVITIVGTKLSLKPADYNHPFGYGRVEYFSALIIALIVFSAGVTSFVESVENIFKGAAPEYSNVTLVIITVAIVVKLVLGKYVKGQGEQLHSDALIASGADALFDSLITFTTLISALIMMFTDISLDGYLGALISLVIIKGGYEMLSSPINELLGTRISSEFVKELKREVLSYDKVKGVYDIILHNYGRNVMIGSLHISVDDTLDAHAIHALSRRIITMMRDNYGIIMTVGIYAVSDGDSKRAVLQKKTISVLSKHKEILEMHGFFFEEENNIFSLDIVPDLSVTDDKSFIQGINKELSEAIPDVKLRIVVDHNYSI